MTNGTFHLTRRACLALATALTVAGAAPAFAQDYPSETITFICAFPAGSGADVLVRYFAAEIQENTGHTIIVENKPGAAGNIAAEYVSRSDPDGYTVYVHAGSATAMNYDLWLNPPLDPRTDLQPVAAINQQAFYITVGADSEHQTIEDLNAYLLEAGEDATYGVSNTSGRILGASYVNALGANPVEVTYGSGGEMMPDALSLAIDFAVYDPVSAMTNAAEGRLRILASGAGKRMGVAPDIPTLSELGFDIDQIGWWGAWVADGTPDDIVMKLNGMFNDVLAQPDTVEFLQRLGGDPWSAAPDEVQAKMEADVAAAPALVDLAGIPRN